MPESNSTQYIHQSKAYGALERIADDVGFLHRGRMMMEENMCELTEMVRKVQVIFPEGVAVPQGFELPGQIGRLVREGSVASGVARFKSMEEREAYRRQTDKQVGIFNLNLEDLFIELIRKN